MTAAESAASGSAKLVSDQKAGLDNQSRQLRTEIRGPPTREREPLLGRHNSCASESSTRVAKAVVVERKTSLAEVVRRRDGTRLAEKIREERFNQRDKIAKRLS